MKKKTTKKRTNKFFSPDRIATEIHQALERDFADAQHEYCISDYPAIAFKRQVADFQKKYCCEDQDKEQLEFETLTNFEHVNEHIGRVNEKLRLKFAGFPTRFQIVLHGRTSSISVPKQWFALYLVRSVPVSGLRGVEIPQARQLVCHILTPPKSLNSRSL